MDKHKLIALGLCTIMSMSATLPASAADYYNIQEREWGGSLR